MRSNIDVYPDPGKPSVPPTWEDIERLARRYPAAAATIILVERGELTREEALVSLVFWFAAAFQQMFSAEVERRAMEAPKQRVVVKPSVE